jgi:phosphoribosylglycinamide formyltransferase-1
MDRSVHEAVLSAGVQQTGCSVHEVSEDVDGGDLVVQKRCAVLTGDTTESLKNRVQKLEGLALLEAIDAFATGTLRSWPQTRRA